MNCESNDLSKYLLDFEHTVHKLILNISNIFSNSLQDKWPDLIVEMHANNETIYYRTDSRIYCFSQNKSSNGRYCGKRHDVILKVKIESLRYIHNIHKNFLLTSQLIAHILVLIVAVMQDLLI